MFDLKNTLYDLRNTELLKLPETSTSKYGTQTLRFKGSLIWNVVPNKFKNLDSIKDFKEHIKDWKPITDSCKLCPEARTPLFLNYLFFAITLKNYKLC